MMLQAKSSTTMMMDGARGLEVDVRLIYIIRARCNLNKVVEIDYYIDEHASISWNVKIFFFLNISNTVSG